MDFRLNPSKPQKPIFVQAYEGLKVLGHDVAPCRDIPGLVNVNGMELTVAQMIDFAQKAGVTHVA